MRIDDVAYRAIAGTAPPGALLDLASRKGDASLVVRRFIETVRKAQRDFARS